MDTAVTMATHHTNAGSVSNTDATAPGPDGGVCRANQREGQGAHSVTHAQGRA